MLQVWRVLLAILTLNFLACGNSNTQVASAWTRISDWARSHGAKIHPSLLLRAVHGSGFGLAVTTPIAVNEALLSVPFSLMLSVQRVREVCPHWSELIDNGVLDDDAAIGLFLAVTRFRLADVEHQWQLYVDSLPSLCVNGASIPLEMANAVGMQNELLEHVTVLRKDVERRFALLQEHSDELGLTSTIDLDQFSWGVCSKQSRSFLLDLDGDGLLESCMSPLIDLANHSPVDKDCLRYRLELQQDETDQRNSRSSSEGVEMFVLRTRRKLCNRPDDCDVVVSYGHHTNTRLAAHFGFVLDHNPHDQLTIRVALPPDRPCNALVQRMLSALTTPISSSRAVALHNTSRRAARRNTQRLANIADGRLLLHVGHAGFSDKDMALLRLACLPCDLLSALFASECLRSSLAKPALLTYGGPEMIGALIDFRAGMLAQLAIAQRLDASDAERRPPDFSTRSSALPAVPFSHVLDLAERWRTGERELLRAVEQELLSFIVQASGLEALSTLHQAVGA